MIHPIYVYGSTVLRKKASEINSDYPGLKELISDMFETLKASDGVGLAAPQIGLPIRLFIVDTTGITDNEDELENNMPEFKRVFINPTITKLWGDTKTYNEGCLSIPTIREDVDRPENVKVEYYDEEFNFHADEFNGLISRIIQHEYDHIEGILFTDRINSLKKRLINAKLNAISKGKVEIDYKVKIPV